MDNLKKYCYTKSSEEYDKYKHLIMLDLEKDELDNIEGDDFMAEYKEKVEHLNEDLTFTSAISYEDDQRMILNTEKSISFEEGVKEGIEEGRKEGWEAGIEENQQTIIKNMYEKKCSLELIADVTNISIEEVKDILEIE